MKRTNTNAAATAARLLKNAARRIIPALPAALLSLLFASCTALAPARQEAAREGPGAAAGVQAAPEAAPKTPPAGASGARIPETAPGAGAGAQIPEAAPKPPPEGGAAPERPELPEYIMGAGRAPRAALTRFLEVNNPQADGDFVRVLADCYVEEAAAEGVNHDVAFAQMCHETGFLRYGGLVTPDMNNFCGLGSIGPGQPGLAFPDPRTGVRAHIQHLKAYASEGSLNGELVDPRFRFVRRGSSPAIRGLTGTWAADSYYSEKISGILERLYAFSFYPAESAYLSAPSIQPREKR
ncbi:MAG: glucosaminidase domain-containing protein [Treponema sp.]|jgi:hypothetical protein|nr:glucosaminidase domain-containing protein [Treponema sp.]